MNGADAYESYTHDKLAEWVLDNNGIEGITLSGGEPLQQSVKELTEFLTLVKHNTDLSVLCYTGYLYEDISANEKYNTVLPLLDVLIDGEYLQEEDFGQRWRGSGNQRFIFLTDRYKNQADEWNAAKERQVEIELDMDGKMLVSGVPSKGFLSKLTEKIEQFGVDLDFS